MSPRELAHYELLDPRGRPVFFETLWKDRPVVLAFVREFGCLLCGEAVAELKEHTDAIEAAGARLMVVGNGSPHFAEAFRERLGLRDHVYTDPSRHLYRAFGFTSGVLSSVNLAAARNTLRALRNGHRKRTTQGDPWQQGGVVVLSRGGDVVWAYRSRVAGDHAPIPAVLDAARRAN